MRNLLLLLALTALISGCVYDFAVPDEFTYQGTDYTNCAANPDFSGETPGTTTLSGEIVKETGTRTEVYQVAKINDFYLFDQNGDPIYNFEELEGKVVTVRGYEGKGNITGEEWWTNESNEYTIKTVDVFFVTSIEGWVNICCDISTEPANVCRWFSMADFNRQIEESNKDTGDIEQKKSMLFTYDEKTFNIEGVEVPLDVNEACKIAEETVFKGFSEDNEYECDLQQSSKTGSLWSIWYSCTSCPYPSGGNIIIDEFARSIVLGTAIA